MAAFTPDSRTENFLSHHGIKFDYVDSIEISSLDDNWRIDNAGRPRPIDEDAIADYGIRMAAGSPAPAVIIMKSSKEKYVVLDGVQRLSAAEFADITKFEAYVLSPRTSLAKQTHVRIFSNSAINGQHTPDKGFLLFQAVKILYFELHDSAEEIARGAGVDIGRVREEIRWQNTVRNMQRVGYEGSMAGKKWFGAQVGKYSQQDDFGSAPGPILEMFRTFDQCNFKNGQAEHLIQNFFDVKRSAKKNRHDQFRQKLIDLKKSSEIQHKLSRNPGRDRLADLLAAIRRATTIAKKAEKNEDLDHDQEFAIQLASAIRHLFVGVRVVVPKDLQFEGGKRRTNIFDKG